MSLDVGTAGAIHSVRPEDRITHALVVDRDSMGSHLLADVLTRSFKYNAAAIPPDSLLQTVTASAVDVVLISADLPSGAGKGFALAELVLHARPQTLIVMLLERTTRASVISAFRAGARGVFIRNQSTEEFSQCIHQVHKGMLWAGPTELTFLLEALRNIPSPIPSASNTSIHLTSRETQVVRHAAQGKTNKAIAHDLGLSEHTIKNYLFRAFEKLGVSNRIELLFYLTMKGHTLTDRNIRDRDEETRSQPSDPGRLPRS